MNISRRAIVLGLALVFLVALAGKLGTASDAGDSVMPGPDARSVVPTFFRASGDTDDGVAAAILPGVRAAPALVSREDTLRRGETLSELFARSALVSGEANALLRELAPHQDLRRVRPGFIVRQVRSTERGETRRLEAQLDPDRVLALRREDDGWRAGIEEVPVTPDTAVIAGVVRSSLYAALIGQADERIERRELERLVDVMADDVFAWQIDFARDLRRGDRFRMVYERLVRPNGTVRSERILGIELSVNGRDYHAYHFVTDDGVDGFYDRDGESLQRAFLRAPLRYRRISSVFTDNRLHPITGRNRPHQGIDYAAPTGTPIYAAGDGTIQRAGRRGGYGNLVDVRHTRGYMTRYAHLSRFADGIRPGVRVRQGEVIGYVGMTGLATGPHLHYEFHVNGRARDPRTAVPDISGDPVPEAHRATFATIVAERRATLDGGAEPVLAADLRGGRTAEEVAGGEEGRAPFAASGARNVPVGESER